MKVGATVAAAALMLARVCVAQPAPEAVVTYGSESAAHELLVRGALDIPAFGPVIEAFIEAAPDVRVRLESWNSNNLYLAAEAACRGEGRAADILISSSVDQQVKLVNDGCARPHRSSATAALAEEAKWRAEIFGVTSEPAVIVYNRALVPPEDAPESRFDLLDLLRREDGAYWGRVATYDIEGSGVGYLFAFFDSQQATTFGSLIEAFARAGTVATCCSAEIIDGVESGRYLVAYNVLGSYALARAAENPDLAVLAPDDYTLVLSRAVMIPKGAGEPQVAGVLIDFLLSEAGHEEMANTFQTVEIGPGGALDLPGGTESALRPIPLSPVLLVGLDQHKRRLLTELWRKAFPPPP